MLYNESTMTKLSASQPLVSIVTVCYNQKDYIKLTLDSLLSQRTDYTYEIVICDDASTDGTSSVVADYAGQYPDKIHATLRKKNIGAQANFVDALKRAKGNFIALCEGDDYWTDPDKLQKQVKFLEANKDFSLCFHPVSILYENDSRPDEIYPTQKEGFTLDKLVEGNFIQTNSVMYRRMKYDNIPEDILPLDWYLHLLHAKEGKIGFIDKVMSVYRRHQGGIWWSDNSEEAEYNFLQKNFILHQKFYIEASMMLASKEYNIEMQHQALLMFERLMKLDLGRKQKILFDVVDHALETLEFPVVGTPALISELYKKNYDQSQKLIQQNESIEKLRTELDSVVRSRSFRFGNAIVKPASTMYKRLLKGTRQ